MQSLSNVDTMPSFNVVPELDVVPHTAYFYVVVRVDIPIEDQACQIAHACQMAGRMKGAGDANVVLLQVADELELDTITKKIEDRKVINFVHHEPDDNMGRTALATEPIAGPYRALFKHLRLWKCPSLANKNNI